MLFKSNNLVFVNPIKYVSQSSVSEELAIFVSSAFTVTSFLLQIFLMCSFGQETMSEYELISYQLWSSDWPDMIAILKRNESKNCQMLLTIFMEVLKRNNKIMIGKVFPLNLQTFTSVICLNCVFRWV